MSKISRETKTEVNRFAIKPIARVSANPRTGPRPNKNRKAAAMIVVKLVSIIVRNALPKPALRGDQELGSPPRRTRMNSKLWRNLVIVLAVTLACLYGVIGVPTSFEEARENVIKNIPLGLDLKGGTHLILQVQVQDAIRAEADQVVNRLQQELRSQDIAFQSVQRNNPETIEDADSIEVMIEGIPTARIEFRQVPFC